MIIDFLLWFVSWGSRTGEAVLFFTALRYAWVTSQLDLAIGDRGGFAIMNHVLGKEAPILLWVGVFLFAGLFQMSGLMLDFVNREKSYSYRLGATFVTTFVFLAMALVYIKAGEPVASYAQAVNFGLLGVYVGAALIYEMTLQRSKLPVDEGAF